MATLYHIDQAIMEVLLGGFVVDEETGEVLFDGDNLDELQAEYEAKLEACACYTKALEAEAAALKAEEAALAERRKLKERKAETMRRYIATSMGKFGTTKLETARCALSFRRSDVVRITSAGQIPAHLMVSKTTTAPDKAEIKKRLKAGEIVPGCELEERQNLQLK